MRTAVYVDGFNLFYGALKGSNYKWLDLRKLCEIVLPKHLEIEQIKYFTANLKERVNNTGALSRQSTYLRALTSYDKNCQIIKGHYTEYAKLCPLVTPDGEVAKKDISSRGREISQHNVHMFSQCDSWKNDPGPTVHVINTEEKGTDVKLAVHIVNDAWKDTYDCCALISNDSDLAEALNMVRSELKKEVALISTWQQKPALRLLEHATIVRRAREAAFANSQLPNPIPNTKIHKPGCW